MSMHTAAAWTYFEGQWHNDNPGIIRAQDQASWLATMVFDGARSFDGLVPDLDQHCARVVRSAQSMGFNSPIDAAEFERLCREGVAKFPKDLATYIRPMVFSRGGLFDFVQEDVAFAVVITPVPMPEHNGMSVTVSPFRRPTPDMAPTDAKAGCLYPNGIRAVREARTRGFDNCIVLDAIGNVAELATANIMIVKDGVVHTPIPNGSFLNGITKQRVVQLLREDGITVEERTLTPADVLAADEIFTTGNYSKVSPITRIEDRELQPGPTGRRVRELYWSYAAGAPL